MRTVVHDRYGTPDVLRLADAERPVPNAHAEFVCKRESGALAHKPAGMTFEEAAAVPDGAIIALACLGEADLRRGRSILIDGASGSIGIRRAADRLDPAPLAARPALRPPIVVTKRSS